MRPMTQASIRRGRSARAAPATATRPAVAGQASKSAATFQFTRQYQCSEVNANGYRTVNVRVSKGAASDLPPTVVTGRLIFMVPLWN